MDWHEAMRQARLNLGYGESEYIDNFYSVLDETKNILYNSRKKWQQDYKKYMNSKKWRLLRNSIIAENNSECNDCKVAAECVHHLSYDSLYTEEERLDCIPLCQLCHMNRHNLKQGINENNIFVGKCCFCKQQTYIFRVDSWSKQGKYKKKDYLRGGFFNFCRECLFLFDFKPNRKFNECTVCFNTFVGKKNKTKCKLCERGDVYD